MIKEMIVDLHIRPETTGDLPGITKINDLAFGQKSEGKLVEKLRKTDEFITGLSLVAEIDGEVIGHILFYPIVIKSGGKEHRSLALAPMSVIPDFQNKGIGSKMVSDGLEKARGLGHRSVIVLGHAGYYPRFGFKPASKWGIKAPFEAPDEAFMAMELTPGELDDKSGIVVYPKEFLEE